MLDVIELNTLFEKLGTPEAGRKLVRQALVKAPVRQVQSRGSNVHVLFNSRKMARVLECESHRVEFPFAVMLEHDPAVLEYYMQPCELHVPIVDSSGRAITRISHVPDALVIREDGIWLEEYKQEARLQKLAVKQPHRFTRDEAGNWRSPPVEAYLADRGLGYRIRSDTEIPHRFVENLLFLRDYYDPGLPPLDCDKVKALAALLAERPCIHIAEAIEQDTLTADDIFQAVADGVLVADLNNESLAEPKRARLFRDRVTMDFMSRVAESPADTEFRERLDVSLEAGTRVEFDGVEYQIAIAGAESVALTSSGNNPKVMPRATLETLYKDGQLAVIDDGQGRQPDFPGVDLSEVHPTQLEDAIQREDILNGVFGNNHGVSDRTLREWKRLVETSIVEGVVAPVAALVPKTHLRGNRTRRVPEETLELLRAVARRDYFAPQQKSATHCYTIFRKQCLETGLTPISLVTFRAELNRMQDDQKLLARFGKRIVYKDSPHFMHLSYRVPVHGVRPWEVCHIDHTELDIELIDIKTGRNLGRPWLTLAIDACTRRIVGFALSFEPPSYRSCMMVIRDIVRRHGRMPGIFVLDNGKEFKSRDFKRLARTYSCDIRYRPAAKSRFGAVMERGFGVANTQFVHNLAGNTKVTKHVRSMVRSVNPKHLAEWALEWFYFAFEYWAVELYDQLEHPALNMTPRQAYEQGMKTTGARSHKLVRFDRAFQILTCPSVDRFTRKVSKARGVKLLGDYYWNDAFRHPGTWNQDVETRIDPWDIRVCYVWLNHRWERCVSKHFGQLGQVSLTELRAYTADARRNNKLHSKELSAHQIVEWVKAHDPNNFKDSLRIRQDAMRNLQAGLGMGAIEPEPTDLPATTFALPVSTLATASIPPTTPISSEDDDDYELF